MYYMCFCLCFVITPLDVVTSCGGCNKGLTIKRSLNSEDVFAELLAKAPCQTSSKPPTLFAEM